MKTIQLNPRGLWTLLILVVMSTTPVAFAAEAEVIRLSEPVASTETHEVFGAMLPDHGKPLSLVEVVEENDKYQDQEVLLATRIAKVCQKKGCFFVATEGAVTARVSFKDYEFFIPTDSGGKDVVLLGTFSRKSVSKEEAEHYAATWVKRPVQALNVFNTRLLPRRSKFHGAEIISPSGNASRWPMNMDHVLQKPTRNVRTLEKIW